MASSGNIATLNPLHKMSTGTFSNGNLKYALSGDDGYVATMSMTKKSYCEVRLDATSGNGGSIGIRSGQCNQYYTDSLTFQTNYSSGDLYLYKNTSGTDVGDIGGVISAGDIVMMAYDPATYKWWVGVNGTWRSSGNPATGANPMYTGSATMFENMENIFWGGWKSSANGMTVTFNFGQDSTFGGQETAGGNADENGFGDFKYTPPTGFLCNSSGNIAISDDIDPAGDDGETENPSKQFNTVLYSGTGSAQSIDAGLQADLVWAKNRGSQSHRLADSTRGSAVLFSDNTDANDTTAGISFDSDGFNWTNTDGSNANDSGANYVAWCWRCNGGVTNSNSEGTITNTLQANTKAGFSISSFTCPSSGAGTLGHGLEKAPDFFIFKPLGAGTYWRVWHKGFATPLRSVMYLQLSNGENAGASDAQQWNNTLPSSTLISLGGGQAGEGASILYAWHSVEGSSKFGTYIGNANADGPFVYTGFRPRMIFVKDRDRGENWVTFDSARNTFNSVDKGLFWNASSAESTGSGSGFDVDFLSNGFKMRCSHDNMNGSSTYIYGAWGDVPFKYNNTF
jgi:hypothetical protein